MTLRTFWIIVTFLLLISGSGSWLLTAIFACMCEGPDK